MSERAHVMVLPFPTQGHINPIFQFSKRLASNGVKVTIISTTIMSKSLPQLQKAAAAAAIQVDCISDGYNQDDNFSTVDECLAKFKLFLPQTLTQLIVNKRLNSNLPNGPNPTVLIFDCVFPWALDVAKNLGLLSAVFYTQSCSICSIYYHYTQGNFIIPSQSPSSSFDLPPLPALPPMKVSDLPSFIIDETESNPNIKQLISGQFHGFGKTEWIFFNSFDKIEEDAVNWMGNAWSEVKTIGPTVPSMYMDKRIEDDTEYGLSLFPPNSETCINWLDSIDKPGSVVYVAFGSLASLGGDQMEEIAHGLKNSNTHFLWVVRASEEGKLPSWFKEETSEKGLVVSWCPQLDVLAHRAIGCFITHCGWNSTLEALSLGVPMVAIPQWSDQATNAKFIVDVWKVGVRVKPSNENGFFTRDEIEISIKQVMQEGDEGLGYELRKNALKWKKLSIEAVDEGGSSNTNIQDFISSISFFNS